MIPIRPREDYARHIASSFRDTLHPEILKLPIDLIKIYQQNGWLLDYSSLVSGNGEAVTYCYKSQCQDQNQKEQYYYATFFPECCRGVSASRLRWSLCHEMAHIVLNHFIDYNLSIIFSAAIGYSTIAVLDREADVFCAELLMPRQFLRDNYYLGIDFLQESCGVSKKALEIRLKALGLAAKLQQPQAKHKIMKNGA